MFFLGKDEPILTNMFVKWVGSPTAKRMSHSVLLVSWDGVYLISGTENRETPWIYTVTLCWGGYIQDIPRYIKGKCLLVKSLNQMNCKIIGF